MEAGDPFTCALWLRSAASAPVVGRIPGSARVSKSHLDKYLLSECLRQEPRSVESQGALANGRSSPYSKRGCRAHSLPGQRAGAPLKPRTDPNSLTVLLTLPGQRAGAPLKHKA